MTETERLHNDYFNWLLQMVHGCKYADEDSYLSLLSHLYDTEFTYLIDRDGNRADDGINLRYRFCDECNLSYSLVDGLFQDKPCSVLEMMIALALRCDETIMYDSDIGIRIDQWFWEMINNLGLIDMTDSNYDEDYVCYILQSFLNRTYKRNGEGGLFVIKNANRDLRKVEIWYQLMWYLDSM